MQFRGRVNFVNFFLDGLHSCGILASSTTKPRETLNMKPVIVTTAHRGVFYGRLSEDQDENAKTLVLTSCRNAIYWAGSKGFLGLASDGPDDGSTIGSTAPCVRLHDVTSVSECTDKAADKWESWS
jgi:hypothetical protein